MSTPFRPTIWQPIWGRFRVDEGTLTFLPDKRKKGPTTEPPTGLAICDQWFAGGTISATIDFAKIAGGTAELVLFYDPESRFMVTAGLGSGTLFAIRHWAQSGWVVHASVGDRANLAARRPYEVRASVRGSSVRLAVEGVEVLKSNLPFSPPQSQVGAFCFGPSEIKIANFSVEKVNAGAFVVMPFTSPFNEVYQEVIQKVCDENQLKPVRADEAAGPGIIIADIAQEIRESQVVIAEITSPNSNVYYEVGYAHAANKPTILLAEKGTNLPFDVAAFRVLYYENTIAGRPRLEEALRKHIRTVLRDWYGA